MQTFKKRISIVPYNKGISYRVIGDITVEMKQILGTIVEKAEIDMGYIFKDDLSGILLEKVKSDYACKLTTIISILKKQKMFNSIDLSKNTEFRIQFTNNKCIAINSTDFFRLEVLG